MAHEQLPIFTFRWGANFGKIYSASQILPVLSALCHVQRWHGSMLCSLHQDTVKRAHTCLHDQHCVSWHSCSCNTHRAIPHSIIFHLPFQIMHLCPINPNICHLVHVASGTSYWCQLSMSCQTSHHVLFTVLSDLALLEFAACTLYHLMLLDVVTNLPHAWHHVYMCMCL